MLNNFSEFYPIERHRKKAYFDFAKTAGLRPGQGIKGIKEGYKGGLTKNYAKQSVTGLVAPQNYRKLHPETTFNFLLHPKTTAFDSCCTQKLPLLNSVAPGNYRILILLHPETTV